MHIHLITLVGSHVDVLPSMLAHYRSYGLTSYFINVHRSSDTDTILDSVTRVTSRFGCNIAAVGTGAYEQFDPGLWLSTMRQHPDDWWILADQDELHLFPDDISSLLTYCDRNGYDYIQGALVDRVAADGTLTDIDPSTPLWSQYPLGGFITAPLLGAQSRKIVAARGHSKISGGHHTSQGRTCPINEVFVQTHHFKWTAGLLERQKQRANRYQRLNIPWWIESDRLVRHCESHNNRIDVSDPRFIFAPCRPAYPYWSLMTSML